MAIAPLPTPLEGVMDFRSCCSGCFVLLPWSWVLSGPLWGRLRPSTRRQNLETSRFAAALIHSTP